MRILSPKLSMHFVCVVFLIFVKDQASFLLCFLQFSPPLFALLYFHNRCHFFPLLIIVILLSLPLHTPLSPLPPFFRIPSRVLQYGPSCSRSNSPSSTPQIVVSALIKHASSSYFPLISKNAVSTFQISYKLLSSTLKDS